MVPFASYVSRGQSKPRLIFSGINGPIVLNYGRFVVKSFRCIIKSIRCNQLFVLNSSKQFRMNYKRVITSQVSETTLEFCSESASLCSQTTCSETTL